jgi:hypothetical protein
MSARLHGALDGVQLDVGAAGITSNAALIIKNPPVLFLSLLLLPSQCRITSSSSACLFPHPAQPYSLLAQTPCIRAPDATNLTMTRDLSASSSPYSWVFLFWMHARDVGILGRTWGPRNSEKSYLKLTSTFADLP